MLGSVVCLAFLIPATGVCLAYLLPSLLKRRGQGAFPTNANAPTFAIVIPAHDEETTLPAVLHSIAAQDYPADRHRVYVVADHCTDDTAEVARRAGAECVIIVNADRRGKGFAVAAGMDRAMRDGADLILVVDADCELNTAALRSLAAVFAEGADVVQASVRSCNADDGPAGYVAAVGAALDATRAAGWDRFGGSVPLRGTGMAFRRTVAERVQWATASPVEDAEYDRQLRSAGVRVRFCAGAVVSCTAPATAGELYRQRRRWAAAGPLASKPLTLAYLLMTFTVCSIAGLFVWWAAALVFLTACLYLNAMRTVGFTRYRFMLLLTAPAVVLRLAGVALAGMVRARPKTWDRIPRQAKGHAA